MNDRGLGYILAAIFGVAGVLLFVVSLATPGVVDNSTITLLGGVFGISLSVIFAVGTVIRRHGHKNRPGEPEEHCPVDTAH